LEHSQGRQLRKKHKGKFIILWVLAGSSFHKAYPYAEYVARHVLDNSDSVIYTVGDVVASLLEWKHPRTFNRSDQWSIRKTMLMTKYADLVIGPETGVMNAAGCFDTPKIIFLSHSSEENLTKYWENVHPIHPGLLKCHPCHKLIYTNDQCVVEPGIHAPLCTTRIPWKQVANEIMTIYGQWREKKWGHTLSVTERSTKRTEGCLTA
jgi:ADP-heptose:LPS heptosyltransferase